MKSTFFCLFLFDGFCDFCPNFGTEIEEFCKEFEKLKNMRVSRTSGVARNLFSEII